MVSSGAAEADTSVVVTCAADTSVVVTCAADTSAELTARERANDLNERPRPYRGRFASLDRMVRTGFPYGLRPVRRMGARNS